MTRFARDMEAAALTQLRNAVSQDSPRLSDEECVGFATASLGREHEALVRRVWAREFQNHMGVG